MQDDLFFYILELEKNKCGNTDIQYIIHGLDSKHGTFELDNRGLVNKHIRFINYGLWDKIV